MSEGPHTSKLSDSEKLLLEAMLQRHPLLLNVDGKTPDAIRDDLARSYLADKTNLSDPLVKFTRGITGRREDNVLTKARAPKDYSKDEIAAMKADLAKKQEQALKELAESLKNRKSEPEKPETASTLKPRSYDAYAAGEILLPLAQKMDKADGNKGRFMKAAETLLLDNKREARDRDIWDIYTHLKLTPPIASPRIEKKPLELVEGLLKNNHGVFLGEEHSTMDTRDFLTNNIAALKARGVDTIFIETNDEWIDDLRAGPMKRPGAPVYKHKMLVKNLHELVAACDKAGVKVRGYDCLDIDTAEILPPSNYNQMIKRDAFGEAFINKHKGKGKYIVLGGSNHSGNFPETDTDRGNMWGLNGNPYQGIATRLHIPSIDFMQGGHQDGVYKGDGKFNDYEVVSQGLRVGESIDLAPAPAAKPKEKIEIKPQPMDDDEMDMPLAPMGGPPRMPSLMAPVR